MAAPVVVVMLLVMTWCLSSTTPVLSQLKLNFYSKSCPQAENIVKQMVATSFKSDSSISAGLLRLHFHDCIIRGCDGSVLLDSNDTNIAEKEAPPNLTLRGFELIDQIKAALEKQCKGVVSCADILALATRDGASLVGAISYALPTGRRDGLVSNMFDVHIPSPTFSVDQIRQVFEPLNFSLEEVTTLLGAHSIGFAHCGFFIDGVYNFRNTGGPDTTINVNLLKSLQTSCPKSLMPITSLLGDRKVFMNQFTKTPMTSLDNSLYINMFHDNAVLQLDRMLQFTDITAAKAAEYALNATLFRIEFAQVMIKLGNLNVLTGKQGEIRKNCRLINKQKTK